MRVLHVVSTNEIGNLRQASQVISGLAETDPEGVADLHLRQDVVVTGPRRLPLARADRELFISHQPVELRGDRLLLRWRLRQAIRRVRPDIIHCWGLSASRLTASAAARQPRVLTLSDDDLADGRIDFWNRRLLQSARHVVVGSASQARRCERGGLQRVSLIHAAADQVCRQAFPDADRDQLLLRFGWPDSTHLIGTMSSLGPGCRIQELIWSVCMLEHVGDVGLLVLGEGPWRESMELLAQQIVQKDSVRFLPSSQWSQFLPCLDYYWAAGSGVGHRWGTLSAMALAVPVVAEQSDGLDGLLESGVHGLTVAQGQSVGFARHTRQLMHEPELAAQVARAAQQHIQQHFQRDEAVARYQQLYRTVARP